MGTLRERATMARPPEPSDSLTPLSEWARPVDPDAEDWQRYGAQSLPFAMSAGAWSNDTPSGTADRVLELVRMRRAPTPIRGRFASTCGYALRRGPHGRATRARS